MKWLEFSDNNSFIPKGTLCLITAIFLSFWFQWILSESIVKGMYLKQFSFIQLVCHLFLHAHIIHLFVNLFLLFIFGRLTEKQIGSIALICCFFIFGVGAGLVHLLFDGSDAIGASGAVSGLIGFAWITIPKSRIYIFDRSIALPVWGIALCWVLKDILFLFLPSMHSATFAHLGGCFFGAMFGLLINSPLHEKFFKPLINTNRH
jgi:membrane associated rhomboid family serine protease